MNYKKRNNTHSSTHTIMMQVCAERTNKNNCCECLFLLQRKLPKSIAPKQKKKKGETGENQIQKQERVSH